jgi:hypothetical protein
MDEKIISKIKIQGIYSYQVEKIPWRKREGPIFLLKEMDFSRKTSRKRDGVDA